MTQRRGLLLLISPAAMLMTAAAGKARAEPHGHGGAIMPRRLARAFARGLALAATLGGSLPAWGQGTTERVSLGPNGIQGNDVSRDAALSADGRFVAFVSDADNLVPGDTNGTYDVFVRDRRTGTTKRVSLGSNGVQGNRDSFGAALSADGRFVGFDSSANNLVPSDTNDETDVFVRDRRTGTTARISLGPNGVQGNGGSGNPSLSADGRFVAFVSDADNLVPGDTNGRNDVFVRDRRTGATARVSLGSNGVQGNHDSFWAALSADGRFVGFESFASNLVQDDTNGQADVFVHALVGFRSGGSGQAERNVDGCRRLRELSLTARWCP
jgi:Tol biopolymer transport system component